MGSNPTPGTKIGAIPDRSVSRIFIRGKKNESIITLVEDNFPNQDRDSILQEFIVVAFIVDVEMVNK